MNREPYLARIGSLDSLAPDLATLRFLHRQHLLQVPFENLDIHLGRTLSLELPALYDKIVRRRRGGFCYELNGLFAWLLRDLGFDVSLLAARVPDETGRLGPPFDHMTLLVRLEDRWLADVGFGDNFLEPVPLGAEEPHLEGGSAYRVVRRDDTGLTLERRQRGEGWSVQYAFDTAPREMEEFAERCAYHQTSSESHFTQKRLCTLATPEGRVTLSGYRLVETTGGLRRERVLSGDGSWHAALREIFGVDLDAGGRG